MPDISRLFKNSGVYSGEFSSVVSIDFKILSSPGSRRKTSSLTSSTSLFEGQRMARLAARPRNNENKPQHHYSSGGKRARYGGDVKPEAVVGANQWSALDGKHVEFISHMARNPKRAYHISIQDLLKTYETRSGKRCNWIRMIHDLSIAARKQMEGVLKEEGWEKHGGHWRQWPLVTRLPAFTEPWREYTLDDMMRARSSLRRPTP